MSREQEFAKLLTAAKANNYFGLLFDAIMNRESELFDWLLTRDDVDWNVRHGTSGYTPLYLAMFKDSPIHVICTMLKRGADVYMESGSGPFGETLSSLDAVTFVTSDDEHELPCLYIDLLRPFSPLFFRHTERYAWTYERCENALVYAHMVKVTEEIKRDFINVVSMFMILDCARIVIDYV